MVSDPDSVPKLLLAQMVTKIFDWKTRQPVWCSFFHFATICSFLVWGHVDLQLVQRCVVPLSLLICCFFFHFHRCRCWWLHCRFAISWWTFSCKIQLKPILWRLWFSYLEVPVVTKSALALLCLLDDHQLLLVWSWSWWFRRVDRGFLQFLVWFLRNLRACVDNH